LHGRRVDIGHHQREGIVCPRFDGGEDIGESEALVAKSRRTLAAFPPDMAGAAFLPDPRFVLEKQPDALITVRMLNYFQQ
jgi:hypothetical protein